MDEKKKDLINLIKLIQSKQFKVAEEKAITLLNQHPDSFAFLNLLGLALINQNKIQKGIGCYKDAIKIKPDFAEAYNNLGIALKNIGKIEESISCYNNAIKFKPDFAEAYNNLGLVMMDQGKIEEAKNNFKKTIRINPNFTFAHRHLSIVTNYANEASHISEMKKVISNNKISNNQKMHLAFGLGKAFEDIKKYDTAFKYFELANNLRRNEFKYDLKREIDFFENIKKIFNKKLFKRLENFRNSDDTPIFIVGMFRSGTTLVEQILSSHPKVYGGGESKVLSQIISHFLPKNFNNINGEMFINIAKSYIDAAKKFQPNYKYITDKQPINFKWIGVIKIAIPNAKIIHCIRNPMDNCLSIYKNYFDFDDNPYAYDLDELGKYYNSYKRLMKYWHSVLPGFIYDMSYEKLIENQKEETEKLLNACKLEWNNKCMNFYKNKRSVNTASVMQVRKPIYKSSVSSWKKYKKHLSVLIERLI